jgi:hypothetical protein
MDASAINGDKTVSKAGVNANIIFLMLLFILV